MKIKRMTFTKLIIKLVCILLPLIILHNWIPNEFKIGIPFIYMLMTIVVYKLGKFIGDSFIDDVP